MKLKLTKDPSHKGYYVDEEGNLYVFRFGGRPIRVDEYREDKPNDNYTAEKLEVDKEAVVDGTEKAQKEYKIGGTEGDVYEYAEKQGITYDQAETLLNINGDDYTEERKEEKQNLKSLEKIISEDQKTGNTMNRMKMIDDQERWDREYNKKVNDEGMSEEKFKELWGERPKTGLESETLKTMTARDIIKEKTGQREMYQSIAKLMNDNEDKLSSEEWKALDNARMILKQNPELIADDSPLLDESKPLHERLSKYMNDNEYKLDSGVWGPLYEANQELRKHDSGEITKLKDRYEKSQGVSDDWFTEEGRKLGMKDEDIANAIYVKKGAESQGSSDANIKRIIAGKEKDKWEKRLKDYEEKISNPNTGDWDREFAKSELQGIKNKIEQYADYEAKFIREVNRDDEPFIVKYSDTDSGFVENFKAKGLDEAFQLQEQWSKYSPDVHIYDINGEEITYDKDRKHYTSPTYEENKKKELRSNFRSRLYGADRASLISMVHRLGLKWNVENFTDQQLYRMLQKELEK